MQRSVLVVEDEFLIALDLQMMLEQHGWQVLGPAPTVAAALSLLENHRPSCALLDVNLGRDLVTPVAERLKAMAIPFAICSAYASPEQIGGPALAGAPNVGKPVHEDRLLATLAEISLDGR